jgi:aminoglycoside phosphotransferase family enzyme
MIHKSTFQSFKDSFRYVDIWLALCFLFGNMKLSVKKKFDLGFRVLKMEKEKAFHHTRVSTLNFWRPTNNFNNVVSQVKAFLLLIASMCAN